jgi:hypothetical protein
MPRLSVWLLRAALLQLGIGFTFGALLLFNKGVPFDGRIWLLRAPHIEIVLLGWTMQLAMGAAFWILPRFSSTQKYGNVRLGWWAFALVNAGVAAVCASTWSGDAAPIVALAGRAAEMLAGLLFAILIWPRVKAFGGQAASESASV